MGFPMQKPEETFPILVKLVIYKKFYLHRAYFSAFRIQYRQKGDLIFLANTLLDSAAKEFFDRIA